jgi:hypothetical protein
LAVFIATWPVLSKTPCGVLFSLLILILLSFGGCLAGGKVFGSRSRFGQRQYRESVVVNQEKAKIARWSVASIAEARLLDGVIPQFIAIFTHSQCEVSHIVEGKISKVFLGNYPERRYKYRIFSYDAVAALFPYRTVFYVSGSGNAPFIWVRKRSQTVKWDGDLLVEFSAFWDAALQARQIGVVLSSELDGQGLVF